jgi:hypothetical protein
MIYKGSCHCGKIAFEVEGELTQVADCNCSICTKMGSLHWFLPREKLRLLTPEADLATYTFGKQIIKHHFCQTCGIHPFGEGEDPFGKSDNPAGNRKAAINARCLEGVDLASLTVVPFDGRSR